MASGVATAAPRLSPLLLLLLAFCLGGGAAAGTEEVAIGEVEGNVTLTCRNVSLRAVKVEWFHGNPGSIPILFSSDGKLPSDARFSLGGNGSLHISGLRPQDEGDYTCREVQNETDHLHRIQLLLASGPKDVTISIHPAVPLPNGTLYAKKHDDLNFTCTSQSQPEPETQWIATTSAAAPELFTDVNQSLSYFVLYHIPSSYQGNYSCSATNPLSGRQETVTQELLVYHPPPSLPRCWAQTSAEGSGGVLLFCNWPGGYPHPTLQWTGLGNLSGAINATSITDTSMAALSSSPLLHEKEFTCHGSHILQQGVAQTCTVQLESPSIASDPMRSCFLGSAVTLSCQLTAGHPPAKITWLRNLSQPESEISSGGRFLIAQEGNLSTLSIRNCSHGSDEGYYVCKAENPVGLREVYIYLTVTEPVNIAGIVGGVVILLLIGVLIFSGILLYTGPHLCLKDHILRNRDANDILILVDSEEEDPLADEASNSALHQTMQLENGCPPQPAESSPAEVPSAIAQEEHPQEPQPTT
ncbi:V-set and immunoglobulin domain-containing protein 10 [Hemicordylus capensis]|uniref:V-set and immunoglobulin domain-containing protein 10 n=1 Tax=Hemicordylus capensis TaxID=884348 RepID=UPI00230264B1|nr:V-set and immunoglobulin domain-containing protein 10 [Hemicordylus capensis]